MKTKNKIIGVDGNWVLHRAFNTTPSDIRDPGAAICSKFVSMISKDALAVKATKMLVAFDGARIFRYKIYPDYKGNRVKSDGIGPYDYLERLTAFLGECGISYLQDHRYEADDVLCSLAANSPDDLLFVSTRDKDAYQYVTQNVVLYDSSAPVPMRTSVGEIKNKMGIPPSLCLDYQTLLGDKIDNIPQLHTPVATKEGLMAYGSLKNWLANDRVIRKKLKGKGDQLKLNRKLVRLVPTIEAAVAKKIKWNSEPHMPRAYVGWKDFCNPKSKGLF